MVISSSSECIIGTHTKQRAESPHRFPDPWSEGDCGRTANWKLPELLLLRKVVNQKQYSIPGGMAQISVTTKDLKGAGMGVPPPPLHCIWPVWKPDDLGERQQVRIGLTEWRLHLQLVMQMRSYCSSKSTCPLVPGMWLLIWQIRFSPAPSTRPGSACFQPARPATPLHGPAS